jgi:predicted TIM-barrel fold metal-dependent hydrolase
MGAIDVWCNPFTPAGIKHLFLDNEEVYFMMGVQWGRTANMKGYDPDEFVANMDRLGIEKVCVPALKQAFYRKNKMGADFKYEDIAKTAQKHPDRIIGLAGINPFERMEGVKRLERAVKEYGFKGAHVHPFGFGLPINAAEWFPFYAKCAELDIPVVFQVGHSAEFMPSACGKPILLDDIALYFPELKLIGGHCGWPWVEELIAMAWKHPNVYIAVSGHAPRYWDPKLVKFLNSRGKGKVMWGTDYPLILHEESLRQIDALNLKPDHKQSLLHDAAATVFQFSAETESKAARR